MELDGESTILWVRGENRYSLLLSGSPLIPNRVQIQVLRVSFPERIVEEGGGSNCGGFTGEAAKCLPLGYVGHAGY